MPWELIGLDEGSAIGLALDRHAADLGRVPRMRTRVGSFDSIAAMVAQGVGIGIMPAGVARQVAAEPRLCRIEIDEAWAKRRFLLCHLPLEMLSSAAGGVAEVLAPSPNAHAGSAK